MASPWKKRASAGPTIGELRQEPILQERLGRKKARSIPRDRWIRHQCRCGFVMGYILIPKESRCSTYWMFDHECLTCHAKRIALEKKP